MKLVAYTRLSQENAHEAESRAAHLDRIMLWAREHGHEVVAWSTTRSAARTASTSARAWPPHSTRWTGSAAT